MKLRFIPFKGALPFAQFASDWVTGGDSKPVLANHVANSQTTYFTNIDARYEQASLFCSLVLL